MLAVGRLLHLVLIAANYVIVMLSRYMLQQVQKLCGGNLCCARGLLCWSWLPSNDAPGIHIDGQAGDARWGM